MKEMDLGNKLRNFDSQESPDYRFIEACVNVMMAGEIRAVPLDDFSQEAIDRYVKEGRHKDQIIYDIVEKQFRPISLDH